MPLDKSGKPILYKPWVNKTKSKSKYFVYVMKDGKVKKIGFGMKGMQQFKDKIGYYKSLDHGDAVRRKSYLARSAGIRDKNGNLTANNKNTSNYWSRKYLWGA